MSDKLKKFVDWFNVTVKPKLEFIQGVKYLVAGAVVVGLLLLQIPSVAFVLFLVASAFGAAYLSRGKQSLRGYAKPLGTFSLGSALAIGAAIPMFHQTKVSWQPKSTGLSKAIRAFQQCTEMTEDCVHDLAESLVREYREHGVEIRFEEYLHDVITDELYVPNGGFEGFDSEFKNRKFKVDPKASIHDSGIAGFSFKEKTPVLIGDVDNIPVTASYRFRVFSDQSENSSGRTRSLVVVPILQKKGDKKICLGIIAFSSVVPNCFTQADINVAEDVAAAFSSKLIAAQSKTKQ